MPSNLSVAVSYTSFITTPAGTAFPFIGGSGTPEDPWLWRMDDGSKPMISSSTLQTYTRKVKGGVDQMVLKTRVPYTVTNTTTSQEEPVSFAEATVTINMPQTITVAVANKVIAMLVTSMGFPSIGPNLASGLVNRRPVN